MFPAQADITLNVVLYLLGVFIGAFVFFGWSHKMWTKDSTMYRFSNWSIALLALFFVNLFFSFYEIEKHTTYYIMTYGNDGKYMSLASWLFLVTSLYAVVLMVCIVGRGFWKLAGGEITPFMYKLILFIEQRKNLIYRDWLRLATLGASLLKARKG